MEKVISVFKTIVNLIIDNWKVVGSIVAVVGFFAFLSNVQAENAEYQKMERVVEMWKEQRPSGHWSQKDDLSYSLYEMGANFKNLAKSMVDISFLGMGQSDEIGQVAEIGYNQVDKTNKNKYKLTYTESGKKVKNIKLAIGESVNISFNYDDTRVLLDFNESEYLDAIGGMGDTRIAFSCTEDVNVASVNGGKITGLQKGTTTLYICSSGYLWEYNIKVK